MTTPATQSLLPVTVEQVDRDALAAYYQHPFVDNPRLAAEVLSDNWRSGASPAELALLDILARHRQAHSLPGDVGTGKFAIGDRVSKKSGANWNGRVVGFYSTALTPIGYAVESEREIGSVQIYPEAALTPSALSGDAGEKAVMVCPQCEGEGGYPDGLDDAACHTDCTRCDGNGWIVDLAALPSHQGAGE